jgi:hypothetical protein
MNSLNQVINGLASSLFLNVGLTSVAEKLDPVAQNKIDAVETTKGAVPCTFCDFPCMFTPESGQ